jgi:hypothetical protein
VRTRLEKTSIEYANHVYFMSTKAEEVKYIACSKCGAPVWVIKEADSARAEKSMQEKGVKRFPVEDKGVIVGRARRWF